MSYDSELNEAYEEAIGLDVEDNGRIWIENQADELRRIEHNLRMRSLIRLATEQDQPREA